MTPAPADRPGSPLEVFAAFLKLGLSAFGGPVAHIGYFRAEFVGRRAWLREGAFADLVALCQFLPGPASSQVGFAIGLRRAGPMGALAAFVGFTLPSAVLMTALALGAGRLRGALAAGLIHGLKLVAVAVVAQAVWGMSRTLTPDPQRLALAALATAIVSLTPPGLGQIVAIGLGAVVGLWLCRTVAGPAGAAFDPPVSRRAGLIALGACLVLLLGGPLLAAASGAGPIARFDAFYRAGALVFGGGHVVLPLLKAAVVDPGWVSQDAFLAGYGAAQAMPGPLFTFAAYLGAVMPGSGGPIMGAALGLAAIFLPGLLILTAALPFWSALRARPGAVAAMAGVNAAVVGILAAALYRPLFTSAVGDLTDFAAVAAGFVLLVVARAPPVVVVILGAAFGVVSVAWGT